MARLYRGLGIAIIYVSCKVLVLNIGHAIAIAIISYHIIIIFISHLSSISIQYHSRRRYNS